MPIPQGYSRNTIYGHLPGGEIFNLSLWTSESPASQTAAQTQANAVRDAFKATNTAPPTNGLSPVAMLFNTGGYDGVRVYSYDNTDGKAAYIADASIGLAGSATSAGPLPSQAAICVTLKTGVAGRSATGRIYVPALALSLSSSTAQMTGTPQGIADWWAAFIHAVNTAVSPGHVCVLSQKNGTNQSVNLVRVDSRVDIQRRRANKQAAVAVTTSVVT